MAQGITTDLIETAKEMVAELCTAWARTLPDLVHADVRLEVTENKVAATYEDGVLLVHLPKAVPAPANKILIK